MNALEEEAPVETPEAAPEAPEDPETPSEPDPTPEPPGEPAPAPAPDVPLLDDVAMEKFYKSLGTRTTTFNNWLSAELGEGANDLQPCPLCADGIMGHIYPVGWVEPTSELQARLFEVIKTPTKPDYQPAPNARQCGTCLGWGKVLSGSKVPQKDLVLCPTCKGNGYQGDAAHAATDGADAPVVELHAVTRRGRWRTATTTFGGRRACSTTVRRTRITARWCSTKTQACRRWTG